MAKRSSCPGASPFAKLHKRNTGSDPELGVLCPVIRVPSLSFDPKLPWPPKNLSELNAWLRTMAPAALGATEAAFTRSKSGYTQWICLSAPNGSFFVSAEIAKAYRTSELLENRRGNLAKTLQHIQGTVKISGYLGIPVDEGYIFSRNLGRMRNLAGKRILLIGCGTVGGFLSQQLAQSGAGAAGGHLTLVDNDTLQGANLGRHLLGAPYLGRNKAEACAEFLREQLPHLEISSVQDSILDRLDVLARHDLVVDATGEEALSIALNEFAVTKRPHFTPMLFIWIEGNGAAAVGFISDDANLACFKCLKADLSGQKRFKLVREQVEFGDRPQSGLRRRPLHSISSFAGGGRRGPCVRYGSRMGEWRSAAQMEIRDDGPPQSEPDQGRKPQARRRLSSLWQ